MSKVKQRIVFILFFLFTVCETPGQNPTATIATVETQPGEVLLPIQLGGFTATVNSFTFHMHFPVDRLSFVSIVDINSGLSVSNVTWFVSGNTLSIAWFDIGSTFQPEGEIFKVKFNYSGLEAPVTWASGCEVTYGPIPVGNITFTNGGIFPEEVPVQSLQLNFLQGYTWFSVNVNPGNMSPNSLFTGLNPCYDDRVIGQNSFALYTGSSWFGALNSLSPSFMYRMKLCSPQSVTIQGEVVALQPVSLTPGYTWIGFQPQQCQAVSDALAGLSPGPAYNDRIIGQQSFALWNGSSWVGSLANLCPGNGYVIRVSNSQTLNYSSDKTATEPTSHISARANSNDYGFPHTMMLVAKFDIPDTLLNELQNFRLVAMAGDEPRGAVQLQAGSDIFAFLSIAHDEESGPEITFALINSKNGNTLPLAETIAFEAMKEVGDTENPFLFHLQQLVGLTDPAADAIGFPVPNPHTDHFEIKISMKNSGRIYYKLRSISGNVLQQGNFEALDADSRLHIDTKQLNSGVYLFEAEKIGIIDREVVIRKVIKL